MCEATTLPGTERILYLLGAGASVPAGLPTVEQLVQRVRDRLSSGGRGLIDLLLPVFINDFGDANNIEAIYSALCFLQEHNNHSFIQFPQDVSTLIRSPNLLSQCIVTIEDEVRNSCRVHSADQLQYMRPLIESINREPDRFIGIVTLNWDNVLEEAIGSEFSSRFSFGVQSNNSQRSWTAISPYWAQSITPIVNLHGSVTWVRRPLNSNDERLFEGVTVPVTPVSDPPMMILGTVDKFKSSPFYVGLYAKFLQLLSQATVVRIVGYSFRDNHVNDALTSFALRRSFSGLDPQEENDLARSGQNGWERSRLQLQIYGLHAGSSPSTFVEQLSRNSNGYLYTVDSRDTDLQVTGFRNL